MPIKLPDSKPSSISKKMPVFEDNEELSYMRTFGRPDMIVLDSYGKYSVDGLMRNFPRSRYVEDEIERMSYIKEYRIINHLCIVPNIYRKPMVYTVMRNKCRYSFYRFFGIREYNFLELLIQIIEKADRYFEEMTAVIMDCKVEDAERDYVPNIKWGIIVDSMKKTVTLLDRESAAVQFHKRFRLIEHTFLK